MATTKEAAPKEPTNPPVDEELEPVVAYKLTHTDVVVRVADGMPIMNDPNNPDRVKYEQWAMAGGVATPADPVGPPLVLAQPEPPPQHKEPQRQQHPGPDPTINPVSMTTTRTRER